MIALHTVWRHLAGAMLLAAMTTVTHGQEPDAQVLRCAAGFGCPAGGVSQEDALGLVDVRSAQEARDRYAQDHPDLYVEDAFEAAKETAAEPVETADADLLRCASGFGCEGMAVSPDDALVLSGEKNRSAARDRYASEFPEAYLEDAFPSEGQRDNPVKLDADSADETSGEIELFDGSEEPSRAIDLFEGEGGPDRKKSSTEGSDFAQLEGYAEKPCAGEVYQNPDFMHMAGYKVALCLRMAGNALSDCGLPAARAFCLTRQHGNAACFGVTTAAQALNVGAYCQGGGCAAFSFIVCR